MKKILPKLAAVTLLTFLYASTAFCAEYLTVTTDNANVRTGPGTNYPASMELFEGYPLKVETKQGDWYKISDFEKDSGWIHESIVKKCDTVIVDAKTSVNMRSGPSTDDSVVADVERGVVLKKLATQGKWTKVQHANGTGGWIYTPLLWP